MNRAEWDAYISGLEFGVECCKKIAHSDRIDDWTASDAMLKAAEIIEKCIKDAKQRVEFEC